MPMRKPRHNCKPVFFHSAIEVISSAEIGRARPVSGMVAGVVFSEILGKLRSGACVSRGGKARSPWPD